MRTVSKVFISLAVVLVLAIAGVFGFAQAYSAKALPRTTVAGIDVSGKTATQIEQQVEAAANIFNNTPPARIRFWFRFGGCLCC